MPADPNVIDLPVLADGWADDAFEHGLVLALATADDLASAMGDVVQAVRWTSGATRVEWWTTDDDGTRRLGAAIGIARGRRMELRLDARGGALVLHGGTVRAEVVSAVTLVAPIVRRRAAEERLARAAIELGRRNQALDDFAALVAHELKTPLHAALLADDPSPHVEGALRVVEALLDAARAESGNRAFVSVAEAVDRAVEDVGAEFELTTDLEAMVPLPPEALRVILRNLLSNAASAGARHVHVATVRSPCSRQIVVEDDGVGLAGADRYAAGSGLGLSLSRRMAGRFGGVLELAPRPCGGTRALLEFPEVLQ
jgi:signal transduction histidine kinase